MNRNTFGPRGLKCHLKMIKAGAAQDLSVGRDAVGADGCLCLLCLLSDGGPRSAGWRDHSGPGESRRRKFDFDFRDSEGHGPGRRRAGSEGVEDDRDGLPEWCTDEEDGEMGTFDSSGAFMPLKVRDVSLKSTFLFQRGWRCDFVRVLVLSSGCLCPRSCADGFKISSQ